MDKDEKPSIQSKRLKQFYETTGYSVNGFAQECNIPSTRTMTQIFTDGRSPSRKVLDKIIARFPQLNHDWVILGYGEMIIPGMTKQPASGTSVLKSKGAAFQQIADKQIETSFGINELALKVEQAMALNAQTTQILTNKVEEMSIVIKEAQTSLIEEQNKRAILFQKTKEEHITLIKNLNDKRGKKMADEFFKLSENVHNHLDESRKQVRNYFTKKNIIWKEDYEKAHKKSNKLLVKTGELAIKELIKNMDKNAIKQTDVAIKQFMDYFSPKSLLSKIGTHTVNKKS